MQEDPINKEPVTEEKTVSTTTKVLIGLGIAVATLAGTPKVDYYMAEDERVGGRQIQQDLTTNELDGTVESLKGLLDIRPKDLTINEVFAIEDIINYKCPNGFSVGEINGEVTILQIQKLLDGNCGK